MDSSYIRKNTDGIIIKINNIFNYIAEQERIDTEEWEQNILINSKQFWFCLYELGIKYWNSGDGINIKILRENRSHIHYALYGYDSYPWDQYWEYKDELTTLLKQCKMCQEIYLSTEHCIALTAYNDKIA